jgi:hypothetical protein
VFAVLEDLTVHLEGKDIMKEMKFIILEQKFLEHIYAGKTFQALKVLQLEIRSEPRKRVTILRILDSLPVSPYLSYCTVHTHKSGTIPLKSVPYVPKGQELSYVLRWSYSCIH